MKEAVHLVRLAVILAAGAGVFVFVRQSIIPKGFGQYGHFRPGALEDNRSKPLVHAGRAACADCHDEAVTTLKKSRHGAIGCEACHGPQFAHTQDASQKPVLPDTRVLCARCHEKNSARPAFLPQVVVKEHAGDSACKDCHKPHSPKMGG